VPGLDSGPATTPAGVSVVGRGFLSGLNSESDPSRDPLVGIDFGGIAAWIDNYCLDNPLKFITKRRWKLRVPNRAWC